MKKFKFFLFAAIAVAISVTIPACSDDDGDDVKINAGQLVGGWIMTSQTEVETGGSSDQWIYDPSLKEYYVYFDADGTGWMSYGEDQFLEIGFGGFTSFTYTISGRNINVKLTETRTEVWKVTSLTNSEMSLLWQDEPDWYLTADLIKDTDEL